MSDGIRISALLPGTVCQTRMSQRYDSNGRKDQQRYECVALVVVGATSRIQGCIQRRTEIFNVDPVRHIIILLLLLWLLPFCLPRHSEKWEKRICCVWKERIVGKSSSRWWWCRCDGSSLNNRIIIGMMDVVLNGIGVNPRSTACCHFQVVDATIDRVQSGSPSWRDCCKLTWNLWIVKRR